MSYYQRNNQHTRQIYHNEKGLGIFYPEHRARVSGISRLYGLAYVDEGWLESDRGVSRVEVRFGDTIIPARLYVKNRYFIRTFDSTRFPDGELTVAVQAWDKAGDKIGEVSQTIIIDNANAKKQNRLFAAPDGAPDGRGTIDSPYDIDTALGKMECSDILFLRGGVYEKQMIITQGGAPGAPAAVINYNGERVEFNSAGIEIAEGVEYLILSGVDQHGTTHDNYGLWIKPAIYQVSVWDSSFCENTHYYDRMPYANTVEYGTGLYAGVVRDNDDRSRIRRYLEISHCRCENNDVDGFQLASVAHGRVQFSEGCYTPDTRKPEKRKDIFQYKHSNGFSSDSGVQIADYASQDVVYLFCYTHHNGQDGWDIAAPYTRLFGCVTHDEAFVGIPFGGVGIKLWQHECHVASSLSFRNNIYDGTGAAMTLAGHTADPGKALRVAKRGLITNCAFYESDTNALSLGANLTDVRIENCAFEKCGSAITNNIVDMEKSSVRRCLFSNIGSGPAADSGSTAGSRPMPENFIMSVHQTPGFIDPESGNFFPQKNSALTAAGNASGFIFDVDGVDYSRLDGLGRPRQRSTEIGPYTRYDENDVIDELA